MISVIVPVYNAEEYLSECIDSLIGQSYKDIEILLVDDGSKDASKAICEQYAEKDARVHVFSQANAGVSVARNKGLQEAKGEYVCFIDADDAVAHDYLKILYNLSQNGDFGLCSYGRDIKLLGQDGNKTKYYDTHDFIRRIFDESIKHPNIWIMLFKSTIIRNNQIAFTPGCVRNEDTEFYIKYMIHEHQIAVSNYKGYYYRDTPDSAAHKFNRKSLTFIDADQRISELLVKEGIMQPDNLIVPASVQYFVYQTASQKNKEIYNLLHNGYHVLSMMRKMTKHPRLSRKGVAFAYILLGRNLFFKLLSLL